MSSVEEWSPAISEVNPRIEEVRKPSFSHPELNSLRFLAFLLVFIDHSLSVNPIVDRFIYAGRYGVPIFFALSAYLIVSLLVKEEHASGTINLPYFFIRRILRIWPLYFATLIGGFIIGRLHDGIWMPKRMLASYLLLAGNFYVAKYGWSVSPASILWSLSIEEQFYLIVPFIARFTRRRGLTIACWLVLFSALPVILYYGHHSVGDGDVIRVNSLVCFQFFALGGLIALHPQIGLNGHKLLLRISLVCSGLLLFVAAAERFSHVLDSPHRSLDLALIDLLITSGTLAIFFGFLNYPAKRRSVPGYLGLISYGLYVFHPWCLELCAELRDRWWQETNRANAIANVVAFLLTVLIAAISYRIFEQPILRMKQRFEIVRTIKA